MVGGRPEGELSGHGGESGEEEHRGESLDAEEGGVPINVAEAGRERHDGDDDGHVRGGHQQRDQAVEDGGLDGDVGGRGLGGEQRPVGRGVSVGPSERAVTTERGQRGGVGQCEGYPEET